MIDLFPFAGLPVAVLGLGVHGRKSADALRRSDADVGAWDDDPANRDAAIAGSIPVRDLSAVDWREFVSLVVETDVPHGNDDAHPIVAAARDGGCEVISDAELLARAQRDAKVVGIVSRTRAGALLDILHHALTVSGRDCEAGGDDRRPILGLHALGVGGVYVLAMPPDRLDVTLSITFDAAVFCDVGNGAWPPAKSVDETLTAAQRIFHRQTGEKGAIVNVDDRYASGVFDLLRQRSEQVVIPVSGRARTPGGVYVAKNVLYDDIAGNADAVVGLDLVNRDDVPTAGLLAATAYATAVVLDVPPHAAMASVRSFFEQQ